MTLYVALVALVNLALGYLLAVMLGKGPKKSAALSSDDGSYTHDV